MHVLFVHQAYPAQFGHIARRLVADLGWECTFVSSERRGEDGGVRLVRYRQRGAATAGNHACSRTFESQVRQAHAVHEACARELRRPPDLIVGHSGLGSTLFLRELYDCPIVNYFEYYYRTRGPDLDQRPDFPLTTLDRLRARARNAMLLLDLDNCDAGYCPTKWQRSRFPAAFRSKLRVIHDGIDTRVWQRRRDVRRRLGGRAIAASTRIVTYVSSGLEAMRGFDVFMAVARRIYRQLPDVLFVVVGAEQTFYGGDERFIREASFKQHVLASGDDDLDRFVFTGTVPAERLVDILSLSDLHIHLSVPFVLSWSLLDALACACVVLASDTAPIREVVRHGENGLLAGFDDVPALTRQALRVLRDPAAHRPLARAGRALVRRRYALDRTLPRLARWYRDVVIRGAHASPRERKPVRVRR